MSFPPSSARPHAQAAFLERHSDTVKCHKFIEEGRRVITGSRDGSLQVWEVDTDSLVGEPRTDAGSGAVHAMAVSRNYKKIFTGSQDGRMRMWEGLASKMDREWKKEHTAAILTICLSPDELYLASGSEDGTVVIWDTRTRKIVGEPIKTDHRHVSAVHYSPDGKTLVTSGYNKSAISWDVVTREALHIEAFSDSQSVLSHSDSDATRAAGRTSRRNLSRSAQGAVSQLPQGFFDNAQIEHPRHAPQNDRPTRQTPFLQVVVAGARQVFDVGSPQKSLNRMQGHDIELDALNQPCPPPRRPQPVAYAVPGEAHPTDEASKPNGQQVHMLKDNFWVRLGLRVGCLSAADMVS